MKGSLPDFVVIGEGRTGTTWLRECLLHHPGVFIPENPGREIHFFSRYYDKGLDWYASLFSGVGNDKKKGDVSPSYFAWDCASKIRACMPDVKIIAIVRNPLERAYSTYNRRKFDRGKVSFEEAIEEDEFDYLERGLYWRNLQQYLKEFNKEQILVKLTEDLSEDPVGFLRDIYNFIGVDDSFVPSHAYHRINSSSPNRFFRFLYWSVGLIHNSVLKDVFWHFRKSRLGKSLEHLFFSRLRPDVSVKKKLKPKTYRFLKAYFKKDVEKLSEFLGRDLMETWKL